MIKWCTALVLLESPQTIIKLGGSIVISSALFNTLFAVF